MSLFYPLGRVKDLRIGQVGEVPQRAFVNPTIMILVDEWVVRSPPRGGYAIASNVD
jgi:hypothetical protein